MPHRLCFLHITLGGGIQRDWRLPVTVKRTMLRAASWLLVAVVFALLMVWLVNVDAERGQVVVQVFAALVGAAFWASRSRPRVTLRLGSGKSLYLELANTGNRAAKNVQVRSDPPIPVSELMMTLPRREHFGLEEFGDMDRNQRYVMPISSLGPQVVELLDRTVFEVSHESTWGFGRRKTRIHFGRASTYRTIGEHEAAPEAQVAEEIRRQERKLDAIERAVNSVPRRLLPPARRGDEFELKSCSVCDWDQFTYDGNFKEAEFSCANCGAEYEINVECECQGMWCAHRPAPRQCSRRHM